MAQAQHQVVQPAISQDIITATEIDFRPKVIEHGTYKLSKLVPIVGGQSVTLSQTSTTEASFEIPSKVLNFSKSVLEFNLNVGDASAETKLNTVHALGVSPIDRISLYTRNGVFLTDINYFNNFSRTTFPATQSFDEMMCNPIGFLHAPVDIQTEFGGLQRCNTLAKTGKQKPKGPGQDGGNEIPVAGLYGFTSITEPRYMIDSDVDSEAASSMRFRIRFSQIPHSILSVNKNLYFGEILVMRIQFAPLTKIGYEFTKANTRVSDALVLSSGTISSLSVWLALETNRYLVETIIRQTAANGMRLLIPYTYTFKYTSPASTNQTVQQRLNRGHGKSLLRIYHSVFNNTETLTTAYDSFNVGGVKASSLYSSLDNERLQEVDLSTLNSDDYNFMRDLLHGSAVQNSLMHKFNWFWCDDWTGRGLIHHRETDTSDCGLDLTQERLWTINLTTPGSAFAHYTFFVTQKQLTITPTQISLV